jgi:hypothetical protein
VRAWWKANWAKLRTIMISEKARSSYTSPLGGSISSDSSRIGVKSDERKLAGNEPMMMMIWIFRQLHIV